ncbi:MAG: LPS export ABC transporter periplasmic protein LptC [Holosporaceae bacterium]|nr:LPS export ABC transporter periplasmic protein LptC [Holosporaceae bacterium]
MRNRRTKIKIISIFFALAGATIFFVLINFAKNAKKAAFDGELPTQKINSFSEAKFKAYDKDGKEVSIKSESVSEERKDDYVLKNSTSAFTLSNGEVLTIFANLAKAVSPDKTAWKFDGAVTVSMDSGLLINTEKMFVDQTKKIASGDSEVVIRKGDAKLSSKKYFFDMNERVLTLIGDAKGFLKSNKVASEKLIIRFDDAGKNIKSADAINKVVLFYEKEDKKYEVRSDVMLAQIRGGEVESAKASGSLIIKTKDAIIRGRRGILKGDKIEVYDDVAISSEQGNVFGNAATLDVKTGDIIIDKSSGVLDDGIRK